MTSLVLGKADSGQTVRLRVGDGLTIELPETPSTGYGWSLTERDEALAVVSSEFLLPAQAPNVVGQGGVRRLVFRAGAAAAKARLEIVYMRPWEGAAAAADRFSVQVQIEP
ncbi:MAG TPA: protease inhibitor I42 family protein [Burkholderiaceae bacterium]|nr:protease inhibitor I42 family protein [Burkholderiaceae bacterium]HMY98561.1 protease inhibitor I42 family protein [Burkholderiaceae bacterium]HNB43545.1 protease inhibitor I42 family protein [Burkholderiaceae bacterium]HNG78527.1 protease inhibitor I42 family protein [Burkholderiaceae bacterium]